MLKDQTEKMMTQLRETQARISQMQANSAIKSNPTARTYPGSRVTSQPGSRVHSMAAVVEEERCIGCGICIDVCREEAIAFRDDSPVVAIEPERCSCCGMCVHECPNEAISLPQLRRVSF